MDVIDVQTCQPSGNGKGVATLGHWPHINTVKVLSNPALQYGEIAQKHRSFQA